MHTYVGQKKNTDGYGLLLIDMENGLSLLSMETGQPEKHVQTKAETYTIEGYNSRRRH
jgi:hypothetical protein